MPYLGSTPSTSFSTVTKDAFSGDGSTVAFTLSKVATTNSISVFVENVRQEPTTAYAVSGTTLTFTAAPVSSGGNNIYVLHMNPTSTATHPAAQNLTAVNGTLTGTLAVTGTSTLTGNVTASADLSVGDDLTLASDSSVINFGADSDVTITHDPDDGLIIKSTATADDNPLLLTLQTGETDLAANDVIGKIAFQAPDEGTGTDAVLVSAAIQARAEGNHSSSSNASSIDFMTGASEAAATKMSLTSGGNLNLTTDGVVLNFGVDGDVDFTHVADKGLTLAVGGQTSSNFGTASTAADNLVVGGTGSTGISILSDANQNVRLNLGDVDDTDNCQINVDNNTQSMTLVANGNNGLIIDNAGAVTKPLQPMLYTHGDTTRINVANGYATGTYHTLLWASPQINIGNDFSSNVYTCPVAGKYKVDVQATIYGNNGGYVAISIVKNSSQMSILYWDTGTLALWQTIANSLYINASADDTIYARVYYTASSHQVHEGSYRSLSIALVA